MWDQKTNLPGGQKKNQLPNFLSRDVMYVTANSVSDLPSTINFMRKIRPFTQIRTIMPNFTGKLESPLTNSFWYATVTIMQSKISRNTVKTFSKGLLRQRK